MAGLESGIRNPAILPWGLASYPSLARMCPSALCASSHPERLLLN